MSSKNIERNDESFSNFPAAEYRQKKRIERNNVFKYRAPPSTFRALVTHILHFPPFYLFFFGGILGSFDTVYMYILIYVYRHVQRCSVNTCIYSYTYSRLQIGWHRILKGFLKTFNFVPDAPRFSWDLSLIPHHFIPWY